MITSLQFLFLWHLRNFLQREDYGNFKYYARGLWYQSQQQLTCKMAKIFSGKY